MRIVGGEWRGLRLAEVGKGDASAHLRPTSDRVREAVFNLLMNGGYADRVDGAAVLDLFAGTGALGLEALSRGAARVTFVENGRVALGLLRDNIGKLDAGVRAKVLSVNATRLPTAEAASGLVFLDPPYGKDLGTRALASAVNAGWVAPGALIVWEEASEMPAPPGFARLDARRYGGTFVTILERTALARSADF